MFLVERKKGKNPPPALSPTHPPAVFQGIERDACFGGRRRRRRRRPSGRWSGPVLFCGPGVPVETKANTRKKKKTGPPTFTRRRARVCVCVSSKLDSTTRFFSRRTATVRQRFNELISYTHTHTRARALRERERGRPSGHRWQDRFSPDERSKQNEGTRRRRSRRWRRWWRRWPPGPDVGWSASVYSSVAGLLCEEEEEDVRGFVCGSLLPVHPTERRRRRRHRRVGGVVRPLFSVPTAPHSDARGLGRPFSSSATSSSSSGPPNPSDPRLRRGHPPAPAETLPGDGRVAAEEAEDGAGGGGGGGG